VINDITGTARLERYRGEDAIVLQVSALGSAIPTEMQRVSIKLYINVRVCPPHHFFFFFFT
jgi:hypothetical protein